jgi:hypothetical protein
VAVNLGDVLDAPVHPCGFFGQQAGMVRLAPYNVRRHDDQHLAPLHLMLPVAEQRSDVRNVLEERQTVFQAAVLLGDQPAQDDRFAVGCHDGGLNRLDVEGRCQQAASQADQVGTDAGDLRLDPHDDLAIW